MTETKSIHETANAFAKHELKAVMCATVNGDDLLYKEQLKCL
jgi:hypothetical protein